MKNFIVAFISLVSCGCALLLIGSTGTDVVGNLRKDGEVYSGYVTLGERNRTFGLNQNLLLDFNNTIAMEVKNINSYPITVNCYDRPYLDRDSLSVKSVRLQLGQSVVGYNGIARGLSCNVEGEGMIKLHLVLSGVSKLISSRQIKVESPWGVSP